MVHRELKLRCYFALRPPGLFDATRELSDAAASVPEYVQRSCAVLNQRIRWVPELVLDARGRRCNDEAMSDVKLFGISLSSYVQGVCAALHEKGVAFEHVQQPPNSEGQLAVHPYGKVPAFAHGDVVLCESIAIMDYIDRVFDGPALSPADAAGRGKMMQWLSLFNSYMYGDLAAVVIPRLIHGPQGQPVDEEAVAASAAKVRRHFELLDKNLGQTAYLAGEQCTLADFNAVPLIQYFTLTPEAEKGLEGLGNVSRWLAAVLARPAMQKATAQPSAAS